MLEGILLFIALIILLLLRIPVFAALIISGSVAYIWSFNLNAWWHWVSFSPWSLVSRYHYSVIPLFLLMGQIATSGDITKDLFAFAEKVSKGKRGGVAVATIVSCAIFGSLCGSSLATAATMTPVSYKEMRSRNYSKEIIFGTLAAGGTLGVLIPPSIILVIYAIIAEESIAHLSVAAIIPAIFAFVGYILAIKYFAYKYPEEVPLSILPIKVEEKIDWKSIFLLAAVSTLFFVMIVGLYTGKFIPTEAASIGVIGVLIIVISMGNWKQIEWAHVFLETSKTTAIIMAIFVGAEIFNTALSALEFPDAICEYFLGCSNYPMLIIMAMISTLLVLGCFMDGIAIVLLIVPLFLPIVSTLNLGVATGNIGVWFGIIILTVVEIGMITPPLGMNLFVIRGLEPELEQADTIKSIKYFIVSDVFRIVLLVMIPGIMILPY